MSNSKYVDNIVIEDINWKKEVGTPFHNIQADSLFKLTNSNDWRVSPTNKLDVPRATGRVPIDGRLCFLDERTMHFVQEMYESFLHKDKNGYEENQTLALEGLGKIERRGKELYNNIYFLNEMSEKYGHFAVKLYCSTKECGFDLMCTKRFDQMVRHGELGEIGDNSKIN